MKQGRASRDVAESQKREPKAHAIHVAATDIMGQATAFKRPELYKGRGYEAPKSGKTYHRSGSQGRHE